MTAPAAGEQADAALLARARAGDRAAVAALYDAHVDTARRLASVLVGVDGAEDLVSDAFTRVLARIRRGDGPVDDFRSYLFATLRNRHRDLLRHGRREEAVSHRPWVLDEVCPAVDALLDHDDGAMAAAFDSLPPRWRHVLWQLAVESRSVADLATELELSHTALTSLASRARQGLRTAYLARGITVVDRQPEDPEIAALTRGDDSLAVRDAS